MQRFTITFDLRSFRIVHLLNQYCDLKGIAFKKTASAMKSYNNQGTYNFQCTIKASFDELRALNARVFNDTKDAKGNGVTVFEGLEKDQTETIREMNKIGDQLLNATLKLKRIEDILKHKK
jgi:hypothetical protein